MYANSVWHPRRISDIENLEKVQNKGRSTVLQLLNIIDDWTLKLDLGGQIDCIYFDFDKVFDKVPHRCLIIKLHSYGIHNKIILWITDFLDML